jgi:hypothetical protein
MDLGIIPETGSKVNSAADHGAQAEGTSAPVADMPVDSEHLDNIGEFEFPTLCILLVILCCTSFFFFF